MPLSARDVQRVLAILTEEDQLKVTVKNSAYGGLIAGIATTVGGLVAGPPGLLVGGAVGGAVAYSTAGDFKPVSEIIRNLNAHDSQLLYESVREIVRNLDAVDYLTAMTFLASGPGLVVRQQLIDKTVEFLSRQMQMYIAP